MTVRSLSERRLWWVKVAHTVIWAVFASAILAIPIAVWWGSFRLALWLSLLTWGEVVILLVNRMKCPLTGVAARFTADRAPNFDIFIPAWLAANNKRVFGALFVAGEIFLLWSWLTP